MIPTPYKLSRPKGLEEYIIRELAAKTYVILDTKGNCRCTRCGARFDERELLSGPHYHNAQNWCPYCRTDAVIKEKRYGRKGLADHGRILWSAKRGRTTYFQVDFYDIDYRPEEPAVYLNVQAQYKFNSDEQRYFRYKAPGWYQGERWYEPREIKLAGTEGGAIADSGWISAWKYDLCYVYPDIKFGTDMKYSTYTREKYGLDIGCEAEFIIDYVNKFLKYQAVELLEKAGFEKIVHSYISRTGYKNAINIRATSLEKIFGLKAKERKEIREARFDLADIYLYKKIKKAGAELELKDVGMFSLYRLEETLQDVSKYTDLTTAIGYMRNQRENAAEKQASLFCLMMSDYADYLRDLDKLQIKLTAKVLRPKNFKEEHELTSQMVKDRLNELQAKNFVRYQKEKTKMTKPYLSGSLLIRPAKSAKELDKESANLHHCVRTYKSKVADGKTAILFIRKQEAPDEPFYTLEYDGKKIVQCRGLYNCGMTDEVKSFVAEWEKWEAKNIKREVAI